MVVPPLRVGTKSCLRYPSDAVLIEINPATRRQLDSYLVAGKERLRHYFIELIALTTLACKQTKPR